MPFSAVKAGCFAFVPGRQPKNGRFELFIFSLFPLLLTLCVQNESTLFQCSVVGELFLGEFEKFSEKGEDDIPIYLS